MLVSFYKTWSDANAYCTNTAINGQPGWHLPTKDELSALYNSGAMKDQGWMLLDIWSSTPNGSSGHYYVNSNSDTGISYVTCVH